MPTKSEPQRRAMEMALSAKKGEIPASKLKRAAKTIYESMTREELEEYLGHD